MASPDLRSRYKDVNEFLLWKWERVFFVFFDRDQSRKVDNSDFYLITRHVRDIYGAESQQLKYARESLETLWKGLLALCHKKSDQQIDIKDWLAVLRMTNPEKQAKWFMDYAVFLFTLWDVSEDNKLDLAEYTDGMVTYGFKESDARGAFEKFAVDDCGQSIAAIDYQKYKKLWHEYFHSTDPNALGNHLFGVLQR